MTILIMEKKKVIVRAILDCRINNHTSKIMIAEVGRKRWESAGNRFEATVICRIKNKKKRINVITIKLMAKLSTPLQQYRGFGLLILLIWSW